MATKSMDAIGLLEADHRAVEDLFKQFEAAGERAGAKKQRLFETIRHELEVHTSIEEEIFYPASRAVDEEMVAEAVEEHHVVDMLIAEIAQLEPSDEAFDAKMTVLMENIEHHVEEEEKELFPKVKKELGADKMRELGDQMASRKQELKQAA